MSDSCSIEITGTGSFLPSHVVTNEDLVRAIGKKTPHWIECLLCIEERRFSSPIDFDKGQLENPDVDEIKIAWKAAEEAMNEARLAPSDIDFLWYVTCTQREEHLHFSRAAIELHGALGLSEDTPALEIDSGCGGFMQAVGAGIEILKGSDRSHMLIVASNAPSRFFDVEPYIQADTWLSGYIFGDGAGALVLSKKNCEKQLIKRGVIASYYAASPLAELMYYHRKNGTKGPVYEIDAQDVKNLFPIYVERSIKALIDMHPFSLDDIDRFYFHQANKRVLENFLDGLGISLSKTAMHVERYGNLSAASTPVLFDEDRKEGLIREGDLCLFCAVGAGMHCGAFLVRY